MSVLVAVGGPDRGKVFELDEPVVSIGRDESSHVCLADMRVSRNHAQVVRRADEHQIVDLESRNGTFVNGTRIGAGRLKVGDVIQVGRSSLQYAETADDVPLTQPGDTPVRIVTAADQVDATFDARRASSAGDTDAISVEAAKAAAAIADLKTQHAIRNLRVLYKVVSAVSSIYELDVLLDKVLEIVFSVLPAERGFIVLADPTTGRLTPRAVRTRGQGEEVRISHTIVNYCIRHEEGVLSTNAMSDQRFESGDSVADLGIRSAICVPLRSRQRVLGVLGVDARISTRTFTKDDLRLMTAIGNQVGVVVENARLVQENIRAERLAAVGEAVASLSHYIKNILQGLQGGATLIETGLEDEDAFLVRRGYGIVDKSQRKVAKLVRDMLNYAGPSAPSLSEVDLNSLLEEIIEFAMNTESAEGVALRRQLDPSLPPIMADPDAINNCVLNIILNAFDAVAEQDEPTVTVTSRLAEGGKRVEIAVTDNGVGIPAARLKSVFNALTSTKGGRGTGLGLAVARKIAQEHGGDVSVASQEGQGSTFTVSLPLRAGKADA